MPKATFTLIEGKTLGATTSAITFSSIPSTYTDLKMVVSARKNSSGTDAFYVTVNGSVSATSNRYADGTGSSTRSGTANTYQILAVGSDSAANIFGSGEMYIPNYATSFTKIIVCDSTTESTGTESYIGMNTSICSTTTAITSITLTPVGGSFVASSTFYLYGINNSQGEKMTKPTRTEINCETGVETIIELTDAEIAQLEIDAAAFAAHQAEKEEQTKALEALKASAKAKLIAGQPLTEDEAATIVL